MLALIVAVLSRFVLCVRQPISCRHARRYYSDSVTNRVRDGKEITDTIWHRVANLGLRNQLGSTVTLDQAEKGKVIIVDFFFTRCASICPILTRNMRRLQDGLKMRNEVRQVDTPFVRFLSLTVDPEKGFPAVLKKYADHYGVNSEIWWMLTGPKKTIYDFALNEFKLGLQDSVSVDCQFRTYRLRRPLRQGPGGTWILSWHRYRAMARLAKDIVVIMLEKDGTGSRGPLTSYGP